MHPHGAIDVKNDKNGNVLEANGQRLKSFLETKWSEKVKIVTLHSSHYV